MRESRSRGGDQNGNDGNGTQSGKLRAAARLGNYRSAWWTGVHRKGADDGGKDVTGAKADEIAVNIFLAVPVGWERPPHRRCLHHADQRDRQGERQQAR